VQPVVAGLLSAVTGFAGSFPILLAGFTAVGASPAEAASGLFIAAVAMGLLGIVFGIVTRQPLTIAWSTPGAALLAATAAPAGGYAVAVGAYLVAAALVIVAGLWRPFGRAVAAIPVPLASAMLAGVLLELCLAPVRAAATLPLLALPIIIVWAVALRLTRTWAVPLAVATAAVIIAVSTDLPPDALAHVLPAPVFIMPAFTLSAAIGIGVPLFVVTMATQNVPGIAVMRVYGYRPEVGPLFTSTGLASVVTAFFGGHTINLAAITAALCAGPEAHPDPAKRWIASVVAGAGYCVLGLFATVATRFVAVSPPLLIEAVAGLALLGSLAAAFRSAVAEDDGRLPAMVTFVVTASGVSFLGIGGAFWGLIAGGALMLILRLPGR
jgi:benzoate membrane transport protein